MIFRRRAVGTERAQQLALPVPVIILQRFLCSIRLPVDVNDVTHFTLSIVGGGVSILGDAAAKSMASSAMISAVFISDLP
jgi:hypothetical protein